MEEFTESELQVVSTLRHLEEVIAESGYWSLFPYLSEYQRQLFSWGNSKKRTAGRRKKRPAPQDGPSQPGLPDLNVPLQEVITEHSTQPADVDVDETNRIRVKAAEEQQHRIRICRAKSSEFSIGQRPINS